MDKVTVVNYCLGLLGLIILQGVISVEGRSIFTSGNPVFTPKEDTNTHSKILAYLFHKSLLPVEDNDLLGMKLAPQKTEFEELQELREDLELGRQIAANIVEDKSIPRKRGEPCFWKYCV